MKNQLRKLPIAALGIAACLSVSGSVRAATAAKEDDVEQRIERVVKGLLPDTALANHFAPGASLKERMAFYHTPGVSIAVINNYRVEWARGFGEPFPQMMHELVFDPLGMKHSTYEQPLPKSWQRLAATSHVWKNQPVSGRWYIHPELAAAGLWTTPSDLARVAVELQLVLKGKTKGILSREKVVEMLTPNKIGGPAGLGFFVWGTGGSGGFNHSGRNEGHLG